MTLKKLKLLWGPTFFLSGPNFFAELAGKSCHFIDTSFRIAVIDTFLRMDANCIASSVKLLYLGILYRFIGAGKFLFCFFLSLHRWKKFWPTKLYRFIRFFSQKLCICIALINTFLSIATHLCGRLWTAYILHTDFFNYYGNIFQGPVLYLTISVIEYLLSLLHLYNCIHKRLQHSQDTQFYTC